MEVKCTHVKVFKSFVYWAISRITEEESNVKNKENGTDRALLNRSFVLLNGMKSFVLVQ